MKELFNEKLLQASQCLKKENIDTWLIFSSEGSDEATGLMLGLKTVGKTFFVLNSDGTRYAICSIIDAQESENSGLFDEVLKYQYNPEQVLNTLLAKINPNKIAINYSEDDNLCDGLTVGRYRWLMDNVEKRFTDSFVSSQKMLSEIRSVKTPAEIANIKKAIEITEDIFAEVFSKIKAGMSEYEVGMLFVEGMKSRGVSDNITKTLEMPIVMTGNIAHRAPSKERIINKGDYLIMDFGVEYNGYVSDISRTAYILKDGETDAPQRFKEIFAAAYEGISRAFAVVKPNVQGYLVDKAARDFYIASGLPEVSHATGHQIGRYCHDGGALFAPLWERYRKASEMTIDKNMVFTLEPTIFEVDGYSVLLEEDILVTENGAEFLSNRLKSLVLIG